MIFSLLPGFATRGQNTTEAKLNLKKDTLVYVGTYTGAKSKGIYLYKLSENGSLAPLGVAAETPNPSFLELDPGRKLLFAVSEISAFEGKPTGAVSSFAIDPTSGKLKFLNQRSSHGTGPCHLVLDRERRHVLVANYGSGSVAVLPIGNDGLLGEATAAIQHNGKSVHPDRQKGPHAHCVTMAPDNRFVFVCDLGLDQVLSYRFDAQRGKLTPNQPPFASLKPGAGPRHMVFRPDARFAYVINELDSTITAMAYDSKAGALHPLQSVSTLPQDYSGKNTTAEIDIHPSGKFLYGSNRGQDTVVVFQVDGDKGTLTRVADHKTGGKTPRHFGIDPSGRLLAVGNQASDTIQLCEIDSQSGQLQPSAALAEAPSPVCIRFLPPSN